MQVWREMEREGMEELVFCYDPSSGLKAIIAIHNTALGPALGGCRCWTYVSEEEAIRDAVKLAKGMTYKNAMAGLPYGGGKAVIWDVAGACEQMKAASGMDERGDGVMAGTAMDDLGDAMLAGSKMREQTEETKANTRTDSQSSDTAQARIVMNVQGDAMLAASTLDVRALRFRALGRCLERLNGRFVTGLDLGTTASDMDQIRVETTYVTDTTGSLGAKDDFTADMTAYGVYIGIVTSLRHQGVAALQGNPVAVQGLGKVGYALCRYLHAAGARLIVADVVPERVQRALVQFSGAISADPARIHAADCRVFAPCALGGVITPATAEELRCSIVAGAANNQLHGGQLVARRMQARGILYAPDYVLNAGGIISTACELQGAGPDLIRQKVAGIAGTLSQVYTEAVRSGISTLEAADRLAEAILRTGRAE
ncbi:glutamate/leucine/phenylalanine/valine dehydrogenase [Paenibacillus barcinonensis]|nr:amino acid dehydrogenase [Paenibacillus barcinonensis]PYE44235.1 glutamate/leucine/phenylalanine/valine dehydrogenase [Paenibacillus barcinonensis]